MMRSVARLSAIAVLAVGVANAAEPPDIVQYPPVTFSGSYFAREDGKIITYTSPPPGMVGDAVTATGLSTTIGSTTFSGLSLTSADVGKLIAVPGAGAGGAPLVTTIATTTTFADTATSTVNNNVYYASGNCTVASPGGAIAAPYAPGDTVTMAGGTGTIATQCIVAYTTVVEITATGTAATDGPCTFVGSTGTGSKFQATGVVTAGVLGGPFVITWGGAYSANPTLAADPIGRVDGCTTLVGTAQVGMGIYAARRSRNGVYTTAPTNPVGQASTTGSGSGAEFTLTYTAGGTVYYGTDNAAGIAAVFARTDNPIMRLPVGVYLTSSCATVEAASAVSIQGDGPEVSVIRLVPECIPSDQSWLKWTSQGSPLIRNIGIDANNVRRDVLGQFYAMLFTEGTSPSINNIHGINFTSRTSAVGISAGVGFTATAPSVENSYFHHTPDIMQNQCITFSQFGGTINFPRVVGNTCVGSGMQVDGVAPLIQGNDASGYAFGTGIFVPGASSSPTIANNKTHGGLLGYDVNQAAAGGIENDAPDALIIGNAAWDNGGAGAVNFGPRARVFGNTWRNNGKSLGINVNLDFKVHAGFRNARSSLFPSASAELIGNVATDDGTGGQNYGYSEDAATNPASKLKANSFEGLTSATNILVSGTTVDTYDTMTVAGLKLPYVTPVITSALAANPTATSSLTNVMAGLAGSFTPSTTGRVKITVCGTIRNSASGSGAAAQIRHSTGSAPANGAALVGTAGGTGISYTAAANGMTSPFCTYATVTGLAIGTARWLDLTFRSVTSGDTTLGNVDWWVEEF